MKSGKMTDAAGPDFRGLDRFACRAKVVERLLHQGEGAGEGIVLAGRVVFSAMTADTTKSELAREMIGHDLAMVAYMSTNIAVILSASRERASNDVPKPLMLHMPAPNSVTGSRSGIPPSSAASIRCFDVMPIAAVHFLLRPNVRIFHAFGDPKIPWHGRTYEIRREEVIAQE